MPCLELNHGGQLYAMQVKVIQVTSKAFEKILALLPGCLKVSSAPRFWYGLRSS